MVACANIYLTEEMNEEFRQEITDNLLRFSHHACLGILVGNNEMEDMIINAGAQNTELVRADYLIVYVQPVFSVFLSRCLLQYSRIPPDS